MAEEGQPVADGADLLIRAVEGDAEAVEAIRRLPWAAFHEMSQQAPVPTLRASAVAEVLIGLRDGRLAPEQAQAWASFMRSGFLEGSQSGSPIIDIQYDPSEEEAIVEAIGRLDELGDAVDGTIDADEAGQLLRQLGA